MEKMNIHNGSMNTKPQVAKQCRLDAEHLPTDKEKCESSDDMPENDSPLRKIPGGTAMCKLVSEEASLEQSHGIIHQSECHKSESADRNTSTCTYSMEAGDSETTDINLDSRKPSYSASAETSFQVKKTTKPEKQQVTLDFCWKQESSRTNISVKAAESMKTNASELAANSAEEADEADSHNDNSSPVEAGVSDTSFSDYDSNVLGIPAEDLPTSWTNPCSLPLLNPSLFHTVLFAADAVARHLHKPPCPFPEQSKDDEIRWDDENVRLPYSPQNKFLDAGKAVRVRWALIVESLSVKKWSNSLDIERAINAYNKYKWDFAGLHSYCNQMVDQEQSQFFGHLLPNIAKLALRLPSLCTQPIPLLKTQREASVTMSQEQAACLLANAFFCTFPARNTVGGHSSAARLPSINFNNLFRKPHGRYEGSQYAKLDCLLHYFRRVTTEMPCGTITYHRQVLENELDWSKSNCKLTDLSVTADGTIEDCANGMLHVDFANKSIGGGVLGEGCVQEEIRFAICPEMIVSRLFTEELAENECLIMNGAERFSNYSGYGRTFRWVSDFKDPAPRDDWGRRLNEIVAIDAKVFNSLPPQLTERNLRRELNKAYCGFYRNDEAQSLNAVATGNWGCGAFGGDHRLKALLQLMAAAEAGRPVFYFTFGDHALCRDIHRVHAAARSAGFTVGQLWNFICAGGRSSMEIYQRILGGQSPEIADSKSNSPCYAADTP